MIFNGGRSGFFKCRSVVVFTRSKGAFTPDANDAKKSCYSRLVGRLNILSLLASFVREIRFICM